MDLMHFHYKEKTPPHLKVAQLVCHLEVGGVQQWLLEIVPLLKPYGVDIEVITFRKKGKLWEEFQKKGIKTTYFKIKKEKFLPNFFKLVSYLRQKKFDILHTHLLDGNTLGRFAGFLAKIPFIIAHEHNIDPWRTFRQKFTDRLFSHLNTGIIAVSQSVRNFLIKEGIPSKKIHVLSCGIKLENFCTPLRQEEARKLLNIPLSAFPVLGNIARLSKQKNQKVLIECLPLILKTYPDTYLVIAGEGKEKETLQKLARDLGVSSRTIFLGVRRDIPVILRAIDIFVFPSLWEGLGLAVLEAMASGVPVIASSIPPIEELNLLQPSSLQFLRLFYLA